jgi:hypothetical protein
MESSDGLAAVIMVSGAVVAVERDAPVQIEKGNDRDDGHRPPDGQEKSKGKRNKVRPWSSQGYPLFYNLVVGAQ